MTTGTVPNFIDVVLNFGNTELSIDSLIYQIDKTDERIVFCGDDTWTKLFPYQFHRKLENKDSLFVNDFYQVCRWCLSFRNNLIYFNNHILKI